jgi:hypothetical protein
MMDLQFGGENGAIILATISLEVACWKKKGYVFKIILSLYLA